MMSRLNECGKRLKQGKKFLATVEQSRAAVQYTTKRSIEITEPGTFTQIQDFPGRQGRDTWRVGIPPSGPMDHYSFRLANRLVGNKDSDAAFEVIFNGPSVTFHDDTLIALTGAKCDPKLDGAAIPMWQSVVAKKGQTLQFQVDPSAGFRSYLAIAGGLQTDQILGSRSTFPMAELGPRDLRGVVALGEPSSTAKPTTLPKDMIPDTQPKTWEIDVMLGPQEAPEYVTEDDVALLLSTTFKVSEKASRLGIRLIGPHLKFSRPHGGEGGSHPSNLNDNPYGIGAINFTGDHPVILAVDGPSLGGFLCPITIPQYELWKMGQLSPGNEVRFRRVSNAYAVSARKDQEDRLAALKSLPSTKKLTRPNLKPKVDANDNERGTRGLVHKIPKSKNTPGCQYRIAGDKYLLIEYGEQELDLNSRVRIDFLEKKLLAFDHNGGVIDTVPGVRSLLIVYDNLKLDLDQLLRTLVAIEENINDDEVRTAKIPSRVIELPLAFRDKWTMEAINVYKNTVRSNAPYVPDNVDFVAKNNGLAGIDEVEEIVMKASYLVLGLGDVYFGAPCAVPLDPLHRLNVPKYNPARTFTPEGAVGIGGQYLCIYPISSPGGYQLIGRTIPIWDEKMKRPNHENKPWLLNMFDQIRFKRVPDSQLEKIREECLAGTYRHTIREDVLDMAAYNAQQADPKTASDTAAFIRKKTKAQDQVLSSEGQDTLPRKEAKKILAYLADQAVNGPNHPGAIGPAPTKAKPKIPLASRNFPAGHVNSSLAPPRGLKNIFDEKGPKGFVDAVMANKGALLTDTTWRDAHQSLLMTRMRTVDLKNIALATSHTMHNLFSLEMWGGATFDVALRFLHECPWDRLAELRELVPNIPFQMLIRGANAVGYSSYPDNVIYKFCKLAKDTGLDIFRVFDSLNYVENMRLGIDAVGEAGGIIEAVICYTGDILNPNKTKYTLEYYLNLARQLVKLGIHVLCVKDMAGLLKPRAATILIGALRKEFPNVPIHVHAHDTANTAVASMLACLHAGANAVDCCNDAMSGLTSQAAMGAILYDLAYSDMDTGVNYENYLQLVTYWEGVRRLYSPFESGQKSAGADVYHNEIPGGQYTNLFFQALSMGVADEWEDIKLAYADANQILGDIVKVTPSSKVVGDLASFMVSNKYSKKDVLERASEINFPKSIVEYLQGYLGQPVGGFPEPFRSQVLKDLPRVEQRPGLSLRPFDFNKPELKGMREVDVMSQIQFPDVYADYFKHYAKYGKVTNLDTRTFLTPLEIGEAAQFTVNGQNFNAVLKQVSTIHGGASTVVFSLNGVDEMINVRQTAKNEGKEPFVLRKHGAVESGSSPAAQSAGSSTLKKDAGNASHVGSSLAGSVAKIYKGVGDRVNKNEPVVVLSAMKMEITVVAPQSGKIRSMHVRVGDSVQTAQLLFELDFD